MAEQQYREGMLIVHPKQAEWGPGKVLSIRGDTVKVHFRDDQERDYRTIRTDMVQLEAANEQADPALDNLPPFLGDRFDVGAKRVSFEDGVQKFLGVFPSGFADARYLGDAEYAAVDYGERAYKWAAHERYQKALGGGEGERLLATGSLEELTDRTIALVSKDLDLLSHYEHLALRDGLRAAAAPATRFFSALFDAVAFGRPEESRFCALADALLGLPVEQGKARAATWPNLTILPALALPEQFMFLKPEPTKECADRLRFDLQYAADLRWITYKKLMEMSDLLLGRLRTYGAQDFIDVQSFIWVVAKY